MGRIVAVISIVLGVLFLIVNQWNVSANVTLANKEKVLAIPTYTEQKAFAEFIHHLNEKAAPNTTTWNKPFFANGGLPKLIRDCEAYIEVKELLVPNDIPVEEKVPAEKEPEQQGNPEPQVNLEREPDPMTDPQETPKKIALTFDDGPHRTITDAILEILQKHQVKATFFVLGENVLENLDVLHRINEQGHEIANHSWSHKNLKGLTKEEISEEINRTNAVIFDAIHTYPKAYRPPYGAIDDHVRSAIEMIPVLWNVDTLDWQHRTPAITLEKVKQQVKDNGIILMHDIHAETAQALDLVITFLIDEGYEFVTTSELMNY